MKDKKEKSKVKASKTTPKASGKTVNPDPKPPKPKT
jgi:hypothetical protein